MARRAVDLAHPGVESTIEEIAEWMRRIAEGINSQLRMFENANNWQQCISSLVMIDILISQIFSVATKMRANPNLLRSPAPS